ncbi:MAG: PHP-associated domain-containing protein [Haloarculaceae archaeon]
MHVKVLDDQVVRQAKARGLDALVYAPHFTRWPSIEERARQFSDEDLVVVPGREIFAGDWRKRTHVLALHLERSIPDYITLEGTMAELDRQGAVVLAPHPGFLTVSLDEVHLRRHDGAVDAIEVYNPKHLPRDNRRARELAADLGIPAFTSSYAHLRRSVGEAWTEFDATIETAADLHAALRNRVDRSIYHRSSIGHQVRCALEFAHLGWENSWKKFDRMYLSGTEPTHPGHVAYGGEFDDVRVY